MQHQVLGFFLGELEPTKPLLFVSTKRSQLGQPNLKGSLPPFPGPHFFSLSQVFHDPPPPPKKKPQQHEM